MSTLRQTRVQYDQIAHLYDSQPSCRRSNFVL